MTMAPEELGDLVSRCDRLKPAIEGSSDPQKKVILKRLEKCRALFLYVLETRKEKRE
jgi:hypothetical protein